jgi:ABC-2 type transport system permease protein
MKNLLLCNWLFIKRGFRKISFIFLLVLLPILCYILKSTVKNEGVSLKAGIYVETDSDIANQITHNLIYNYESVSFEYCNTLDELKNNVTTNVYECGYVIKSDFEEKLAKNDLDDIVDVYTSPSTFMAALTNEYVFSEIFKEYAINELAEFIANQDIFSITNILQLTDELRPIYNSYLESDKTFTFEYINADNEVIDNTNLSSSYVLLSLRGVIALIIMFAAFIGTFNLYKDSKSGIFFAFKGPTRTLCKMSDIFSLTFISCMSGLLSIVICGLSDGILLDMLRLLLYAVICTIYCFVLYKIMPNTYTFAALVPVLVLGSIIFCPIFLDMSEIIPITKYVTWLFLPKYFFII